MPLLHLIPWFGNFVVKHSFRIVSGESPETMRKLCLSTKFSHQEIRWNNDILRSVLFHDGGPYHKETRIYRANQWTGFYMIGSSV